MFKTLIYRHSFNLFSKTRFFSINTQSAGSSSNLIQNLLRTDIVWNAFPESVLDNPLCYWNKFAIYINDDPKIKEKFIITHAGEERGRINNLPVNWKIRATCAEEYVRLGIPKQAIKSRLF